MDLESKLTQWSLALFSLILEGSDTPVDPHFEDEMLDRLVQGKMDRLGTGAHASCIPLRQVNAKYTVVTQEGARRILSKDGVGPIKVVGNDWTVKNQASNVCKWSAREVGTV